MENVITQEIIFSFFSSQTLDIKNFWIIFISVHRNVKQITFDISHKIDCRVIYRYLYNKEIGNLYAGFTLIFLHYVYRDGNVYMCVWERRMLLCGIRIFNLFSMKLIHVFWALVGPLCQIPFYFLYIF